MDKKPLITLDETWVIKGLLIIQMYFHHFFLYPEWIVTGAAYPAAAALKPYTQYPTKIVLATFAFFTGYVYFFKKEKNYKDSFKKITDLLVYYWVVYAIMLVIAVAFCGYQIRGGELIQELFGLRSEIMTFSWYITFFIVSMLLMPIVAKVFPKNPVTCFLLIMLFDFICKTISVSIESPLIIGVIGYTMTYFPCSIMGYLVAQNGFFEKMDEFIAQWKLYQKNILWICGVIFAYVFRYYCGWICPFYLDIKGTPSYVGLYTEIFTAPIFVYCFTRLYRELKDIKPVGIVNKVLDELGRKSMLMWFIHCIFFSDFTKAKFQPFLYICNNAWVVIIWGLAVCYLIAFGLDKVITPIVKAKKKAGF